MALDLDLGKQVGPLPVGAWIAVVGGGLGIAIWARNKSSVAPTIVDDTSGQPGVGDGTVGGWVPTSPPSTDTTSGAGPATNEAWAVQAINWLIAQGYPAAEADSAIRKYIAGNDPAPSIKEYALQQLALQHLGSPPQPLPPSVNEPPSSTPGPTNPPGNPPPPSVPSSPAFQQVQAGWLVDQWIDDLRRGYGSAGGNRNASYSQLVIWNPTMPLNIDWRGTSRQHKFIRTAVYRIR